MGGRPLHASLLVALALSVLLALPAAAATRPAWLRSADILVAADLDNQDCRKGVCKHNENTDLTRWRGDILFVHRTAGSQVLGPNSSLRVMRSTDEGRTFRLRAIIPAPPGRDIRDPVFYTVGRRLYIKAITRLPGFALRDKGAGSISVESHSSDARSWSAPRAIGPERWGFWRVARQRGELFSAAYEDGDLSVRLFRSRDGRKWRRGAQVYGIAEDTPLETELVFSPSGRRMLALVRMDGNDYELFGHRGRLRTKVCWAARPYRRFSCPQELDGVRLDGAVAWYWRGRLFVLARKHLKGAGVRKRTALYEIRGNLEGGPIRIVEHGELPSAGDTAYAGVVRVRSSRGCGGRPARGLAGGCHLATWYSSPPAEDPSWIVGFGGRTDIWRARIDLSRLARRPR